MFRALKFSYLPHKEKNSGFLSLAGDSEPSYGQAFRLWRSYMVIRVRENDNRNDILLT